MQRNPQTQLSSEEAARHWVLSERKRKRLDASLLFVYFYFIGVLAVCIVCVGSWSNSCELPYRCWRLIPDPLEELSVSLTTELSPAPGYQLRWKEQCKDVSVLAKIQTIHVSDPRGNGSSL